MGEFERKHRETFSALNQELANKLHAVHGWFRDIRQEKDQELQGTWVRYVVWIPELQIHLSFAELYWHDNRLFLLYANNFR